MTISPLVRDELRQREAGGWHLSRHRRKSSYSERHASHRLLDGLAQFLGGRRAAHVSGARARLVLPQRRAARPRGQTPDKPPDHVARGARGRPRIVLAEPLRSNVKGESGGWRAHQLDRETA